MWNPSAKEATRSSKHSFILTPQWFWVVQELWERYPKSPKLFHCHLSPWKLQLKYRCEHWSTKKMTSPCCRRFGSVKVIGWKSTASCLFIKSSPVSCNRNLSLADMIVPCILVIIVCWLSSSQSHHWKIFSEATSFVIINYHKSNNK